MRKGMTEAVKKMAGKIKLFNQKPKLMPGGMPDWFNRNGVKTDSIRRSPGFVSFANRSTLSDEGPAKMTVNKLHNCEDYRIDYRLEHGTGDTEGSVRFSKEMLEVAFGIIKPSTALFTNSRFPPIALFVNSCFLGKYGGDAAILGGFIKWKNYLNVPMPGTGADGDPNISIEVTPRIRKAIKDFLKK